MDREPGYYWIRFSPLEDLEPAMFTGEHWVMLGTEVSEDDPEEPEFIGPRIEPPPE